MDNISINKANNLYWLGRYAERAYTTIGYLKKLYDEMVDKNQNAYFEFCTSLGITNDYIDKKDFIRRLIYDEASEVSIAHYLNKTYDNGIVLRDILTSKTLSYIQLASNALKKCNNNEEHIIVNLQQVTDNLIAFWGAVDDYIVENNARDLIKAGKYIERLELYNHFNEDMNLKNSAINRLSRYASLLKNGEAIKGKGQVLDTEDSLDYNAIDKYINEISKSGVDQ